MKNKSKKFGQAGFTLIEYIVAFVIAAIVAAMVYTYIGSVLVQSTEPIFRLQEASNLRQVMENIIADYNRLNKLNLRYAWKASTAYPVNSVVVPRTNNGHYYRRVSSAGTGTSAATEPAWPTATGATVVDGGVTWTESGNVYLNSGAQYPNNTIVVPYYNNGHYYKCNSGTRASSGEPLWPISPGSTVLDGTVTWTEAGTILESNDVLDNLKNHLTANPAKYGTGYMVIETKFIQFNGTDEVAAGSGGTSTERSILKVTIKNNNSSETLTELFTIH